MHAQARSLLAAISTVLLLAITVGAQKNEPGSVMLRAAIDKAQVDGDLNGALKQFQVIVDRFGKTDRAIVAVALVRMAECYQKLGDAQAQKIYERVVRDYSDQSEAVVLARTRLGRFGESLARARGDRAVWTGSKVDLFGRVSRDGRFVTYVDWTLYGNLALHDIASNTDHLLTRKKSWDDLDGGEGNWGAVSPDGRQVAYGWLATDKEIRIIAIDSAPTSEPRVILKFNGNEVRFVGVRDWSLDGRLLAVQLARTDGTSQIGVISLADGSFRVLKSTDWRGADRLAFSNDGKYLAYDLPASDKIDQRDVFVLAVDGSQEIRAVAHTADDQIVGWSPDGRHLLFSSDRTGSYALWAMSMAEGRPQGSPELLKGDIGANSYPLGLTKSGSLFVYKNIGSRDVKMAGIDLAAGKLAGQTVHFSQGYLTAPQDPHWSPDGKYLVYQTRGSQEGLAIRSIETGEARPIPRKLLYARDPRWSPDGKSLIVGGRDGRGRDGVFQVDVQSGEFTPIIYGPRLGSEPRWSADGTKIYYRDFATPGRVLERDLRSGAEREVFRHPRLRNVEVSPDGRMLAVETTIEQPPNVGLSLDPSSQAGSLIVVSIADGSSRELLRSTAPETFNRIHTIAWTPDSRSILMARNSSGRPELWSIDIANGRSRKFDVEGSDWEAVMAPQEEFRFLDGGFSLSPDGRHIAFLMGKSAAEVWALENFLPPATTRP